MKTLKILKKSTSVSCFFEKLAKKGQILKTFRNYNVQNLEEFEKNQLPFPVFGKIKVLKANFSNFLLKYRENLKNSKLKISKKSTSVSGFLKNWLKKVKFSKLFATITPKTLKISRKIHFRFRFFKKKGLFFKLFARVP